MGSMRLSKKHLVTLFPGFSPKRAFAKSVDGWEVVGKHVNVAFLDDDEVWDVFIFGAQRKVNSLASRFPKDGVEFQNVVDGEAWWQSYDLGLVRGWLESNRIRLGIRAKITVSPEKLKKLRDIGFKIDSRVGPCTRGGTLKSGTKTEGLEASTPTPEGLSYACCEHA